VTAAESAEREQPLLGDSDLGGVHAASPAATPYAVRVEAAKLDYVSDPGEELGLHFVIEIDVDSAQVDGPRRGVDIEELADRHPHWWNLSARSLALRIRP